MNFTEDSLAGSNMTLDRLKKTYRRLAVHEARASAAGTRTLLPKIEAALDDNMNTSVALAELLQWPVAESPEGRYEFERTLWLLGLEPHDGWLKEAEVALPADFAERLRLELGGEVALNGAQPEEAIAQVIGVRNEARARKDFAASDRLRDALARCGVAIKDSKEGTTWTVTG
jgi:cysteinyl-tRNA synthetase